MKHNNEIFETMPVPKAILKNAVPTIISMVVIIVYNIADTFFVGQTGDPMQVAAVSLATPVFLLFMASGNLIGIGGTSVISRSFGEKKDSYARNVSSFCFYTALGTGIIFSILFWIMMPLILRLIGTSPDTIIPAREYLSFIAPSAPFVIIATAFSNIVRAEGKSNQAVTGMILGSVINIILDPFMILTLDMGVAGAAIATLIGNVFGASYYIFYLLKADTRLSILPSDYRIGNKILTGVFAIGIPAAFNNVLMSTSNIILNNFMASYGDIEVAAMGVAMKVGMIVVLLQIGLGIGIQPLLGFSYGAKNGARFREIMKTSVFYVIIMGVTLTTINWFGAGTIVRSFIDNEAVYNHGVVFVKALLISGPVIGVLFVFMNSLQAMGAAGESLILSLSRQGLVFIPLLFIFNSLFNLTGIVYAQPVADIASIAVSIGLYNLKLKKAPPEFRNAHKKESFTPTEPCPSERS